jgi:hypothetical protein
MPSVGLETWTPEMERRADVRLRPHFDSSCTPPQFIYALTVINPNLLPLRTTVSVHILT